MLHKVFSFRSLLLQHGYLFLASYVFAVQAGLPIPADPLLLIMGALTVHGPYVFVRAWLTASVAAFAGDFLWFELGRARGRKILNLLCRFSLEPDYCVQSTEDRFARFGPLSLLFAKFVPGMSLIATPLAGATKMPRMRFAATDAAGCLVWTFSYVMAGRLFHNQVNAIVVALGLVGRRATVAALFLIALYVGWRYLERWRFRRQLRVNRLTPQEAAALIKSGDIMIIDLRSQEELETVNLKIAGALTLNPDDLRSRSHSIPKGQEVILYCS